MAVEERSGHVFVTVVGPTDRNYIPTGSGRVVVLNGQVGTVLHAVTVGIGPGAVAVDEQTGHAFVVSSGGIVSVPDAWGWVPSWLRERVSFLLPPAAHSRSTSGSVSMFHATH